MMLLVIGALALYGGFAALCAASTRHARDIWKKPPSTAVAWGARGFALGCFGLGLLAFITYWGNAYGNHWTGAMGVVSWLCLLSIVAMAMVFAFSYAGRKVIVTGAAGGGVAWLLALAWLTGQVGYLS